MKKLTLILLAATPGLVFAADVTTQSQSSLAVEAAPSAQLSFEAGAQTDAAATAHGYAVQAGDKAKAAGIAGVDAAKQAGGKAKATATTGVEKGKALGSKAKDAAADGGSRASATVDSLTGSVGDAVTGTAPGARVSVGTHAGPGVQLEAGAAVK